MSHFTVYNAAGEIVRAGQCPDEHVADQVLFAGEFAIAQESDPTADMVDPVTQQVLRGARPAPPIDMDYRRARLMAYPDLRDQLDMLWHAMDDKPALRTEPFYSTIKTVKDAYPKDNSVVPGSVVIFPVDP